MRKQPNFLSFISALTHIQVAWFGLDVSHLAEGAYSILQDVGAQ